MRNAFLETLLELAEQDERIVFITGDLGYGVVEQFRERRPKQFLNVGVAEQNMTGVAAGMAMSGKVVFTYSIANFPTLRCLEHVRNDVCYHDANVKIVSVGGGLLLRRVERHAPRGRGPRRDALPPEPRRGGAW